MPAMLKRKQKPMEIKWNPVKSITSSDTSNLSSYSVKWLGGLWWSKQNQIWAGAQGRQPSEVTATHPHINREGWEPGMCDAVTAAKD